MRNQIDFGVFKDHPLLCPKGPLCLAQEVTAMSGNRRSAYRAGVGELLPEHSFLSRRAWVLCVCSVQGERPPFVSQWC